jgi:hypothetical protein
MLAQEIVNRLSALEGQRSTLDNTLDIIEQFVVPYRGRFFNPESQENEIEWRKREIYDSTAVYAAQILAASIHGALIATGSKWFTYRFRQEILNDNDEAMEWLQECEEIVYFALEDSNFDVEVAEFLLDLVSYGTCVITEEIDDGELDFSAVPMKEIFFERNRKDQIMRFYRRLRWTALQMIDKFGEEGVPQVIRDKAGNPEEADTKHDVIFCVYNRPENKGANTSSILTPDARPFGYKYVFRDSSEEMGEEGGYYEMPAFVAPYQKVSGSQWGHSPAMIALADILTLNEITETTLEALAKVVDPATLTTERGLLSDLDLEPGGLTVVRSLDEIDTFESGARFDVGEMKIENYQASINRAFHVDQLELKSSPEMTAAEVHVRYELMQRLLGPTLGRMKNNFLDPLMNRSFNILFREGKFPDMPKVVAENKGELKVEYIGPMPRAQKMQTVSNIQNWVTMLGAMAEIFPDVMDLPDVDNIGKGSARMMGVPDKYITDDDTLKKVRGARKRREDQANKVAMAQAGGEAAQAVGDGAAAVKEVLPA